MYEYVILNVFDKEIKGHYEAIDLPVHVTLCNIFYSNANPEQILDCLSVISLDFSSFKVRAISRELFGEDSNIKVTELEKTKAILNLHLTILEKLGERINVRKKQFTGFNYRPHVSDQKSGSIKVGQLITIDNLTLFEIKDNGMNKIWSLKLR